MPYEIKLADFFTLELVELDDPVIWILNIEHSHSADTNLFETEEAADEFLFLWVKEYWDENIDGDMAQHDDKISAVVAYFDARDNETYYLTTGNIYSYMRVASGAII